MASFSKNGFSSVEWTSATGIYSTPGYSLKNTYQLDSGIFATAIYNDSAKSSSKLIVTPNAELINISGSIIQNTKGEGFIFDSGPYRIQAYNDGFSHYKGGDAQEHVTIIEKFSESKKLAINTTVYEGGGGVDTIFYPNFSSIGNIKVNALGFTLVESFASGYNGYSHKNYHIISGFEKLELLDKSFGLPSAPLFLADYTYGQTYDGMSSRYSRGAFKEFQVIDNRNNIFILASHYDNGIYSRFPDSVVDFGGGIDFLIIPHDIGRNTVQFINGKWLYIQDNVVTTLRNLEFIVFTDKSFELGGDGTLTQHQWLDISSDVKFLNRNINTPAFTLTPSTSSINEGSTLTTTVSTTNVASGTTLYYSLSGTGITAADFSSGALTGSGTVGSNGSFSFSYTVANDQKSEGRETLEIKLFSDSSRLLQVGSTATVAIIDFPGVPTYTINPGTTAIIESATLTTTVSTTNVASGTTLYYSLSGTGITAADFSSGALTGSGTVGLNGSFSFSHTLANDLTTEGSETLNIKLYSDSSLSAQVGFTASVEIVDTSLDVNEAPTNQGNGNSGAVTSSAPGIFRESVILTAPVVTADPDGDALNPNYAYQWFKGSSAITNATASTYAVPASGAGTYKVAVTYTDAQGFIATVSSPEQVVSTFNNGNGTPASITGNGAFKEGVTLTAGAITGDPDGDATNPNYAYQWFKGSTAITNATASTYAIPASGAGTYKVAVTYTDAQGFIATLDSPEQDILTGIKILDSTTGATQVTGNDGITEQFALQTNAAPSTPFRILAFNPTEDILQIPKELAGSTAPRTFFGVAKVVVPDRPLTKSEKKSFGMQQNAVSKSVKSIGTTGHGFAYNQLTGELFIDTNGKKKGFGVGGGLLAVLEDTPAIGIDNFQFL